MAHGILETELEPILVSFGPCPKNLSDNELNGNDKMMSFVEDISNQDSIQAAVGLLFCSEIK